MPTATFAVTTVVAGVQSFVNISRSGDGSGVWTPQAPAGSSGSLTTRTDADTGVVTAAGHGITDGDTVDVMWSGGRRYGMAATVVDDEITVDGGAGDALPAEDTAVVVATQVPVNVAFDPDDLVALLLVATAGVSVTFKDAGGVVLANVYLPDAQSACVWFTNSGLDRPMTGNPVASITIACASAAAAATVTLSVIYDATP